MRLLQPRPLEKESAEFSEQRKTSDVNVFPTNSESERRSCAQLKQEIYVLPVLLYQPIATLFGGLKTTLALVREVEQ